MKNMRLHSLYFMAALPLSAVQVGDSYDQVIAEKGAPKTKMEMSGTLVLNYTDQRIKLKENKVVDVREQVVLPPAPSAPAPAPKAQPSPKAAPVISANWTTDYPAALAKAKQDNTKVFLFFTGSDWCGWCKRLDHEILSTAEFVAYANTNLTLVKVDFPRRIPQDDALKAKNAQLAKRYRITGYPTIIVLNSKGMPVAKLGYGEGGPGPFIAELNKY